MSHSEKQEPNSEDNDREDDFDKNEEASLQGGKVGSDEIKDESGSSQSGDQHNTLETEMAQDARFSRLMKMRSQFVTEETLRSTEELSKPKQPDPPPEDEELYDDEEFYDEDYPDDEIYEDDFEDDDYEDEGLAASSKVPPELDSPNAAFPEEEVPEEDPDEEVDHRVAELRKLRQTFVTEDDLKIKANSKAPEIFKETKLQLVVCPHCQSEEPRAQKICAKCGAKLPNITAVEEEKYNPGTLNKAVLKYFDAVKRLRDETWSVDEFTEFLHERETLSRTHIDGILELVEECGSKDWLPDATKLIFDSTIMLEDSIAAMIEKVNDAVDAEEYADDHDAAAPATLEERILAIDFMPELNTIKDANSMMLDTLKLIDEFQKQAQADLEVSM